MLEISKKGENPKFEDFKIFENSEICSLESGSYFLLEAKKLSAWSLEFFFFQSLENLRNLSFKDIS